MKLKDFDGEIAAELFEEHSDEEIARALRAAVVTLQNRGYRIYFSPRGLDEQIDEITIRKTEPKEI